MPIGRDLGLLPSAVVDAYEARERSIADAHRALQRSVSPDAATLVKMNAAGLGGLKKPATLEEILRRPEAPYSTLRNVFGLPALDVQAAEQVETEVRYAGYIRRQQARAEQTRRLSSRSLEQVDFNRVPGLSMEVRERLQRARPPTLATASRLPGITPAAVDTLAVYLARQ